MTETQERPSRLAMEIAVHMEVHAALSTTTEAKAREIDSLLAADRLVIRQSDTRIEGRGEEPRRCFICAKPFKVGEMVLSDVTEGLGHRACFGEDRDGYVNLETGDPIGPDEPIPTGWPYEVDPSPPATNPTPEHVEGDVLSVGVEATRWSAIGVGQMAADPEGRWVSVRDLSQAQSALAAMKGERDVALLCQQEIAAGSDRAAIVARIIIAKNDAEDRAETAEAQLADAVKVLEDAASFVREKYEPAIDSEYGLMVRIDTFLSTIGEKPDAE